MLFNVFLSFFSIVNLTFRLYVYFSPYTFYFMLILVFLSFQIFVKVKVPIILMVVAHIINLETFYFSNLFIGFK